MGVARSPITRQVWDKIIAGGPFQVSVTDMYEWLTDASTSSYYGYLERIGSRLHDYHAWRNVVLR